MARNTVDRVRSNASDDFNFEAVPEDRCDTPCAARATSLSSLSSLSATRVRGETRDVSRRVRVAVYGIDHFGCDAFTRRLDFGEWGPNTGVIYSSLAAVGYR